MAYCLGVLGKTLVATSQKAEALEKLIRAREIWLELRKSSPLAPQQEAARADVEKTLSALQNPLVPARSRERSLLLRTATNRFRNQIRRNTGRLQNRGYLVLEMNSCGRGPKRRLRLLI